VPREHPGSPPDFVPRFMAIAWWRPGFGHDDQPPDTTGRLRASTTRDLVSALLAEILIAVGAMLPRQVLPRQFYLITRRCAQRQFLLHPDAATNNAFLYCLIAAALRCEIDVLLPCAMSNHYLCAAAHNQ